MTATYVVTTGAVAAGATTLAEVIARHWKTDSLLEGKIEELNPFFSDAQTDPRRWAFASQAHFLAASGRRHDDLRILLQQSGADIVLEDRTPFEHHGVYDQASFASGYVTERELNLLTDLAGEFEKTYETPDVLIYREMSADQLTARVVARGREGEAADFDRLRVILETFDDFAAHWTRSALIRVPAAIDLLTPDGEQQLLSLLDSVLPPR